LKNKKSKYYYKTNTLLTAQHLRGLFLNNLLGTKTKGSAYYEKPRVVLIPNLPRGNIKKNLPSFAAWDLSNRHLHPPTWDCVIFPLPLLRMDILNA
jgi:hypothetical protein